MPAIFNRGNLRTNQDIVTGGYSTGAAGGTPQPVNILLVDDQPKNLIALEAIIESLGQNIVKAQSGKEALRRLLDQDFAVILLDVQMPELDGFEAARMIRSRDRSRHTPIIFLTAFEPNDVQTFQGYSLGAVDFLFKPIIPEILRSKVSVFVELCQKSEEIRRQAELLRENERREHERRLAEERQRWELERLRAEAAREKKISEQLAEADRRKDEFLAMLGHELRNPLAPVFNAIHVLRLSGVEPALQTNMLDMLERQVRHMARLIDDLLDVSRITRGKIQLRKEIVDLVPILHRAVESTRPLIEARKHQLHVDVPSVPIYLEVDPTRMEQVFANLLNNAAKYTEEGGQIWLSATANDTDAHVVVRDTGIGMTSEMLPQIFDLFTQAERSLDRAQGGLGIGLTLVRSLVGLHGGTIEAASPGLGHGSEFTVRLPLANRSVIPQPPVTGVSDPPPYHARILIVDDHPDVAHSLQTVLRLEGHEVQVASNGQAGLESARSFRPEVVLLDIGLPDIDGFEVARQLRQDSAASPRLLVAMTGYGQEQDRQRCREAGFDFHLVKPVDLPNLRQVISYAHSALA